MALPFRSQRRLPGAHYAPYSGVFPAEILVKSPSKLHIVILFTKICFGSKYPLKKRNWKHWYHTTSDFVFKFWWNNFSMLWLCWHFVPDNSLFDNEFKWSSRWPNWYFSQNGSSVCDLHALLCGYRLDQAIPESCRGRELCDALFKERSLG